LQISKKGNSFSPFLSDNMSGERSVRNVILLGKGDLAIRVADWFLKSENYRLITIVPVIPEPTWTASLGNWAAAHRVPIVGSGHYKDLDGVTTPDWSVDLAVSVFYDKIIKAWFIDKCKKIINLHNGPLPKYRGVSPINWALKNEEVEHGVTIHEITPGIDDGAIIGQVKYSIYPKFDEVVDVYKRSIEYGWTLFQQTIPLLDKIAARPQNESQASYYSKLDNPRLGERSSFTRAQSQPREAELTHQ
jgi:methionyl-tRNA formyltransferase